MMKKLIMAVTALFLVLAVVWAGATWYIGNQAETELRDGVAQANQRMNQMLRNNISAAVHQGQDLVELTLRDYQKGLLSTHALLALTPTEALRQDSQTADVKVPESLEFTTTIVHGPVLWRPSHKANSAFGLAEANAKLNTANFSAETQQQIEQLFAGKEPFIAQFTQSLGASNEFDLRLNPMSNTDAASGLSFNLGAIRVKGNVAQSGQGDQAEYRVPADYEMGSLTLLVPNEGFKIDIAGMEGNSQSLIDAQGTVINANSSATIPRVSFSLPDLPEPITFAADLASQSEVDDAGIADGGYQVTIKDLVTPLLPTSSLDLNLDFTGINLKAIESIQDKLQRLNAGTGAAPLSDAEANEVIDRVFNEVFTAERSQVKQTALLENKLGQAALDVNLRYQGTQGKTLDSVAAVENLMPQDWIQMLDGDIDFYFDHDLFPMASLFLGNQPFIVKNDKNQYAMKLTLQGDEFALNGDNMSFTEFSRLVGMTMMGSMGRGMAPPAASPSAPPQSGGELTEDEAAELQQLMEEMEGMQMEPAQ